MALRDKMLKFKRNIQELIEMAVPTNKDELLNVIESSYNKLQTELLAIPEELTTLPKLDGYSKSTFMSIHHLVSYLTGWGELVLK